MWVGKKNDIEEEGQLSEMESIDRRFENVDNFSADQFEENKTTIHMDSNVTPEPISLATPPFDDMSVVSLTSAADLEKAPPSAMMKQLRRQRAKIIVFATFILVIIALLVSLTALRNEIENLPSITDTPMDGDNEADSLPSDETDDQEEKIEEAPESDTTTENIVEEFGENCRYKNVMDLIDKEIYSDQGFQALSATGDFLSQQEALNWLFNLNDEELNLCDTYKVVEKYILAVLYFSTRGEEWTTTMNFLGNENICLWNDINGINGVHCDETSSEVTSIRITQNNLVGTLPTELAKLVSLEKIIFDDNKLSSEIPTEFGKLSNLLTLSLKNNKITGTIPYQLGKLSALHDLRLMNNKLTGKIPSQLGVPPKLIHFRLDMNQITGSIPSEIGNLNLLKTLDLSENKLTGSIPAALGFLNSVTSLNVNNNELLGEIPSEIGVLYELNELNLSDNKITGTIPNELGNLNALETLHIHDNILEGTIPSDLGKLSELKVLSLYHNILSGSVPASFENLENLEELNIIWRNDITGDFSFMCNVDGIIIRYVCSEQDMPFSPCDCCQCWMLEPWQTFRPLSTPNPTSAPIADDEGAKPTNDNDNENEFTSNESNSTSKPSTESSSIPKPTSPTNWEFDFEDSASDPQQPLFETDEEFIPTNNPSAQLPLSSAQPPLSSALDFPIDCDESEAKYDDTKDLLKSEVDLDVNALGIQFSPEQQAFQWLSNLGSEILNMCDPYTVVEKFVLALFYYSTNGGEWFSQHNFILDGDVCSWNDGDSQGVFCDENTGSVTELKITGNNLMGTIPTEIAKLISLKRVIFDGNQLSNKIPTEFGTLPDLVTLSLMENILTGSIPIELGNLARIHDLKLSSNTLSGRIPTELSNAMLLNHLLLNENGIEGSIPTEFGKLVNLQSIVLSSNMLTGSIPTEFGVLELARKIDIDDNDLIGPLPKQFGRLKNLQELTMDFNHLTGTIPTEFGNMESLLFLELHRNKFTGTIPSELGKLSQLKALSLYENMLTGTVPTNLFELSNLEDFDVIYGNDITGDYSFICQIDNATIWYVCAEQDFPFEGCTCCICWEFPPPTRKCDDEDAPEYNNLETLLETEMNFVPSANSDNLIPQQKAFDWLSKLNDDQLLLCHTYHVLEMYVLAVLYYSTDGGNWGNALYFLSDNDICLWNDQINSTYIGVFCDSMHPFVTRIKISGNSLFGAIPTEIGKLYRLEEIIINENRLTGTIPSEIANLQDLTTLEIKFNALEGTLSRELFNLNKLEIFNLHYNYISGTVPTEIGNLMELKELDVSGNLFTGSIPTQVGLLAQLDTFEMSGNALTGSIPTQMGFLTSIEKLNFDNCSLTGAIPTEFGKLIHFEHLSLSSNSLTSSIPTELGLLTSLNFLALNDNGLTGGIPSEFGNLEDLMFLYLYDNALTGDIPKTLANLGSLQDFDVIEGNDVFISENALVEEMICQNNLETMIWVECENKNACSCCTCWEGRRV